MSTAIFQNKPEGTRGGFALLVAEKGDYDSFAAFRAAVKAKANVDLSKLSEKTVRLTAPSNAYVEVSLTEGILPAINRNGELRDWKDVKNWNLWQTVNGELVSLGWKEGTLKVTCAGKMFSGTFTLEGWQNPGASPSELEKTKKLKSPAQFSN